MKEQLWWYVARASGLVGWLLLSASVVWGLAMSGKVRVGHVRPNWMLDLHRFLGGLAVVFTGVHVTGIVADSYVHFGPAEVLVPLASAWRPGPVAWGVVSMYLLAAIELTSLARRRMPRRWWRRVHAASFPLFVTSTTHALTAGSDTGGRLFHDIALGVCALVAVLTIVRLREVMRRPGRPDAGWPPPAPLSHLPAESEPRPTLRAKAPAP